MRRHPEERETEGCVALDRAIKQLRCSSDMHTHNIGLRIENNRGSVCLAKSGGSPRDLRQVCFFLPLVVEIGRQVNSRATTQPKTVRLYAVCTAPHYMLHLIP